MGIFTKLFAKEQQSIVKEHIEDWTSYFSNVDNKYSSIAVDLGFYKIAPITDKDNILWISIKMEDEIVELLQDIDKSLFVGRLTSDGERTLYFHLGQKNKHNENINKIMKKYPSYKYQFGIVEW